MLICEITRWFIKLYKKGVMRMFLDIGLALLICMGANSFLGVEITLKIVIWAVIFSLLPDFDFLIEFAIHKSVGGRFMRQHRKITHYPIIYIPIVFMIWIVWGKVWLLVAGLCLLAHFVHDSMIMGWGVQWGWPVSKRHIIFFRQSVLGETLGIPFKFFRAWSPKKVEWLVSEYGDPSWVKNYFISPIFFIEMIFFILIITKFFDCVNF